MFKKFIRRAQILAFLPFYNSNENPYDVVAKDQIDKTYTEQTGFERLKAIFQPHHEHPLHPALISIFQTAGATFFFGGIYGGIRTSRATFIDFIENNQATQFRNHLEAKKLLSDKMFLSFIRGFGIWGTKISFFSTSFTIAYTIISLFNNDVSILNYTFGGMYAGAIYKFPLGPKGMVSGAFFGSFFGSLYGCFKVLLFKITNMTEKDFIEKKFELSQYRNEALHKSQKKIQLDDINKELSELMTK